MKNQIAIYGGFSMDGTSTLLTRDPTRFPTILSGDIDRDGTLANNSYSVIRNQYYPYGGFNNFVDSTAILDGFIVTGANGNGAIVNDNANPTIINCVITGNVGGGVSNISSGQARFINCLIAGNTGAWGGGMSNSTSSPQLINCIIRDNIATNRGGGISNDQGSYPLLTNCTFVGNSAPAKEGGAISNYLECLPKLVNCILWNNGGEDAIVDQPGDNSQGPYHGTYGVQATNCLIEAGETTPTGSNNKKALVSPFESLTTLELTVGSEAVDAGSNEAYRLVNGPLIDFKGNSRILNGIIDLGAIEYAPQSTLATNALSRTTTCPGSTLAVSFSITGSYSTNTVFTVQVSDGGNYIDIPTKEIDFSYGLTIRASMPTDLPADRFYSIRVRAANPTIVGTPSPTRLYLKGKESKPAPPSVDSLQLTCEGFSSFDYDRYVDIPIRLAAGATPRLYYETKTNIFSESATYPLCGNPPSDTVECKKMAYMRVGKAYYNAPSFVYPVDEKIYYISQLVDGCESDRVPTKVRILWRPRGGPAPANQNKYPGIDYHWGYLAYCLGQKAYPLNVNGHSAPPSNYQVVYYDYTNAPNGEFYPANGRTLVPPIPDTHTSGVYKYSLSLEPIDKTKGCALLDGLPGDAKIAALRYLIVTVIDPQLSKPLTTTNTISYLQGQPSTPLSATSSEFTASLVWYGTNAVGGVGSAIAPTPATDKPGQFTYYVAQKVDSCESERVGIPVVIHPLLGIDDPGVDDAVEIFPNPIASTFMVRIHGLSGRSSAVVEIQDLAGQTLLRRETQLETTVLTLDQYPAGSYLLLISAGNRRASRRIVKL